MIAPSSNGEWSIQDTQQFQSPRSNATASGSLCSRKLQPLRPCCISGVSDPGNSPKGGSQGMRAHRHPAAPQYFRGFHDFSWLSCERTKPLATGCKRVGQALVSLSGSSLQRSARWYVSGLSKCQVIGHSLEITATFGLMYVDCLEEESLSFHVHSHGSHLPVARCNFCLPDLKVASLVQVSQQAASEFDVLHEVTINCGQSFLFAVDPHFAFHVMENEPPGMAAENSDWVGSLALSGLPHDPRS